MKSQSIAYLLNESEHTHWLLDLEGEVHSLWDQWISGLQECKGNNFFEVGQAGKSLRSGLKKVWISLSRRLRLPESTSPEKFGGGGVNVPQLKWS